MSSLNRVPANMKTTAEIERIALRLVDTLAAHVPRDTTSLVPSSRDVFIHMARTNIRAGARAEPAKILSILEDLRDVLVEELPK